MITKASITEPTHWIFDLDGTLTVPAHDFAWLRNQLGIDASEDILDSIARRPAAQAQANRAFIAAYEDDLARNATVQPDAVTLLEHLAGRGCVLGLLTRNSLLGARLTLQATGLSAYFPAAHRVGRDCALPKPHPAGVRVLLNRFGVPAQAAVMVGDWIHDVRAGHAAGTATVLVQRHGPHAWDDEADRVVTDLRELC